MSSAVPCKTHRLYLGDTRVCLEYPQVKSEYTDAMAVDTVGEVWTQWVQVALMRLHAQPRSALRDVVKWCWKHLKSGHIHLEYMIMPLNVSVHTFLVLHELMLRTTSNKYPLRDVALHNTTGGTKC